MEKTEARRAEPTPGARESVPLLADTAGARPSGYASGSAKSGCTLFPRLLRKKKVQRGLGSCSQVVARSGFEPRCAWSQSALLRKQGDRGSLAQAPLGSGNTGRGAGGGGSAAG